jgi:hypothetical protein
LDGYGNLSDPTLKCGLTAMWTFVTAVDDISAEEGCRTALTNYVNDLCRSGGQTFPYACRLRTQESIKAQLDTYAGTYCDGVDTKDAIITRLLDEVQDQLGQQLQARCADSGGLWVNSQSAFEGLGKGVELEQSFLFSVYNGISALRTANSGISLSSNGNGGYQVSGVTDASIGYGLCVLNQKAIECRGQDTDTGSAGYARFDPVSGECIIDEGWYQMKCQSVLNGTWNSSSKICVWDGKLE